MHIRKSSLAVLAVGAALLVGPAMPASATHGSPNPSVADSAHVSAVVPATLKKKTIKAVVVESWDGCSSTSLIWDDLNANWSSYGSIPISIDYSDPDLCGTSFTLAGLEASGAQVVILNDPAGGNNQYTPDEVNALLTYADEGHDVIGTYLVFAYNTVDNTALAPLFGLVQDDGWTGGTNSITPTYNLKAHKKYAKALVRNVPNPYVSSGFTASQLPGDGAWSSNDLSGAKLVGLTSDAQAAITVYRTHDYNAIYIANMSTYGGGVEDEQFFYNALIYPKKG